MGEQITGKFIRKKQKYITVHSVFLAVWWATVSSCYQNHFKLRFLINDIGECCEFCARLCTREQNRYNF